MEKGKPPLFVGIVVSAVLFTCLFRWPLPAPETRLVYRLFFEIAVISVIAGALICYANKWLGLYLLLALASWVFRSGHWDFLTLYGIILACTFYLLFVVFVDTKSIDTILDYICVIAIANVGMLILQYFNSDPLFYSRAGGNDAPVGFMSMRNEVSALLAFSFPAFLRGKWKFGTPVVFLGLLMSRSFGGVLAVVAGLCFYCSTFGVKNILWPSLLALVLLVGLAWVMEERAFTARLEAWSNGLKLWADNPDWWIRGAGLGQWKVQMAKESLFYENREGVFWWKQAHNELLQGLFEMGAGFLLLVFGYLVNIYKRYRQEARLSVMALVIIIANCCVNFPMHVAPTAMVALMWLAILEVRLRGCSEEKA